MGNGISGKLKLSENLVWMRHEKGVTQEALANYIGVTKASVSKWETGQSTPDILLLPVLASYFDVTVDELLGYEPQLGREQIREVYHRLAADFARKPFGEVMEESRRMVKQYNACYPFLLQICVLWLNHFMLAEDKRIQTEVLEEMVSLCERILEGCRRVDICNQAVNLRAVARLNQGRPRDVIEALEPLDLQAQYANVNALLMQAYMMEGKLEQAERVVQVDMYHNLIKLVGNGVGMMQIHMQEPDVCETIMERLEALIDSFELEKFNPNMAAIYHYQAAVTLCGNLPPGASAGGIEKENQQSSGCGQQRNREAPEMESASSPEIQERVYYHLEKFVNLAALLLREGIVLHGDAFFDRLDEWIQELDLGAQGVRDRKLVWESTMKNLEHPLFARLPDQQRMKKMKKVLKEVEIC